MGNTCPIPVLDGKFKHVFGATEQLEELAQDPENIDRLWMTQHSVAHRCHPDPSAYAPYGIAPFAYDQKFGATLRQHFSRDKGEYVTLCKFARRLQDVHRQGGNRREQRQGQRELHPARVLPFQDSLKAHRAQCRWASMSPWYAGLHQELITLAEALDVEPLVVE